jgi:hypothetical protein
LRSGSDAADPFAPGFGEYFARLAGAGTDFSILAAGDQPQLRLVERGGKQSVMDGQRLVAMIEPMDRAVGERKMRDAAEENGGDAMAIEIERSDCRHVGS